MKKILIFLMILSIILTACSNNVLPDLLTFDDHDTNHIDTDHSHRDHIPMKVLDSSDDRIENHLPEDLASNRLITSHERFLEYMGNNKESLALFKEYNKNFFQVRAIIIIRVSHFSNEDVIGVLCVERQVKLISVHIIVKEYEEMEEQERLTTIFFIEVNQKDIRGMSIGVFTRVYV